MSLVTCKEYAEKHGLSPVSVRHKCMRGGFSTARKIGRDWLIDEDEPNIDHRIRHGNLIGSHAERRISGGKELETK